MRSASIDTTTVPVPWADLLPELCGLIVDRLDAFSALRFPAVCKSWAAAFQGRLRSGAPTLLTSSCAIRGDKATSTFALHDVSSHKTFHADAEGLKNRRWVGAKDDWLVTTDYDCNVELLNPATGHVVRLPSFATIPGASLWGLTLCIAPRSKYLFRQVALCRTPAHRDGYLAIARFSCCLLAFTAAGDERWTMLKTNLYTQEYSDTIAHEGKIFAVDLLGNVYSWNMDDGANNPPAMVHPPEIIKVGQWACLREFSLALSTSGQLLLVCVDCGDLFKGIGGKKTLVRRELPSNHSILLHELDVNTGAWRRVNNLGAGDRALFVGGMSYPFYVTVAPHGECSHLKANNVYAADLPDYAAIVFDMHKGCAKSFGSLLYPNSNVAMQRPIWFRPTNYPLGRKSACTSAPFGTAPSDSGSMCQSAVAAIYCTVQDCSKKLFFSLFNKIR